MLPYWFSAMTMKSVGTAAIKVCMHVCMYVHTCINTYYRYQNFSLCWYVSSI
jgi:hypothetical protein